MIDIKFITSQQVLLMVVQVVPTQMDTQIIMRAVIRLAQKVHYVETTVSVVATNVITPDVQIPGPEMIRTIVVGLMHVLLEMYAIIIGV